MGLNIYAILNQIYVITGTQYDPSAFNSITGRTQDDDSTLNSRTVD